MIITILIIIIIINNVQQPITLFKNVGTRVNDKDTKSTK